MPKRSGFAVALGLHSQPGPATKRNPDHHDRLEPRKAADGFYFQLESFLDVWRHHGIAEDVVRDALERASRTSLAMEDVGKWLKGR